MNPKRRNPNMARYGNTNRRARFLGAPAKCSSCGITKAPDAFCITRYKTLSAWCKDCTADARKFSRAKKDAAAKQAPAVLRSARAFLTRNPTAKTLAGYQRRQSALKVIRSLVAALAVRP